ncbi:hypothetical protein BDF14DRAFT_1786590 [Spinellus fusiger]|nr:hypothetical protein BDF14DRAFT_1786590 [Spinellus fusiger]
MPKVACLNPFFRSMSRKRSNKKARLGNLAEPATESQQAKTGSDKKEEDFILLEPQDKLSRQEKRNLERKQKKHSTRDHEGEGEEDTLKTHYELFCPWLPGTRAMQLPPDVTAHQLYNSELECLLQYLEPTHAEVQMRNYIIHKIRTVVRQELSSKARVEVFGSFASNVFLPDSDIDLVVISSVPLVLKRLGTALDTAGVCKNLQVILHASVPVIKFKDRLTGLRVDIILDSTTGLQSAQIIRDMIRSKPALRSLTLLVKLFLATRSLNEVFVGGLGGYAIVCLVMSLLQQHPKIRSRAIIAEHNVATLLLDFFQLYGFNFNISSVGISVKGEGSYYCENITTSRRGGPVFNIEDPRDPNNDIGSKSFNAVGVTNCFHAAYLALTNNIFNKTRTIEQTKDMSLPDLYNTSMLEPIFFIPDTMIRQREIIQKVYQDKQWQGEMAAKTFKWTLEEDTRS